MAVSHAITGPESFLGKTSPEVISFGSGWPDIEMPAEVLSAIREYDKKKFPYGEIIGNHALRGKIAQQRNVPLEGVGITNGASEAMNLIVSGMTKANDKILLAQPYYYSYPHIATINKCSTVFTHLRDWHLDAEDIEKKIKGCRIVFLNSPANPTGSMESAKTIRTVQKLCAENNSILLFDEVYENFAYGREQYSPRGDNVVCVNSFSKTYGMCGLRVGYMYSRNAELIHEIMNQKTHTSMNTSVLGQEIALAALSVKKRWIESNKNEFRKKRDILSAEFEKLNFKARKPEGAFYLPVKVDFTDPQKLLETLFFKYKVIAYNGAWFGMNGYLRFSFTSKLPVIEQGLKRIQACIASLKKR